MPVLYGFLYRQTQFVIVKKKKIESKEEIK